MPRLERWEVTTTILPPLPCFTICSATNFVTMYTLRQSASMMYCHSSTLWSSTLAGLLNPWQTARMFTSPYFAAQAAMQAFTSSSFAGSATKKAQSIPSALNSSSRAFSFFSFRPVMNTFAPA